MRTVATAIAFLFCTLSPGIDCCAQRCCRSAIRPVANSRIQPPGNLQPHVPYRSENFYYYDRPYNAEQIQQRMLERNGVGAVSPRRPYSNQMFETIFEDFERNVVDGQLLEITDDSSTDGFRDSIWRDRYLEYTDWQRHRIARQDWLAKGNELGEAEKKGPVVSLPDVPTAPFEENLNVELDPQQDLISPQYNVPLEPQLDPQEDQDHLERPRLIPPVELETNVKVDSSLGAGANIDIDPALVKRSVGVDPKLSENTTMRSVLNSPPPEVESEPVRHSILEKLYEPKTFRPRVKR